MSTGKPKIAHPRLPRNRHGLTYRDYEGAVSTLCAGCGHDSVTGAIVQAAFELELEPRGSDFERRVWAALQAIPFGQTRSYGDIARSLGQPGASRAVGLARL